MADNRLGRYRTPCCNGDGKWGLRVQGQGLGFGASGLGFRFRVQGSGFRLQGLVTIGYSGDVGFRDLCACGTILLPSGRGRGVSGVDCRLRRRV